MQVPKEPTINIQNLERSLFNEIEEPGHLLHALIPVDDEEQDEDEDLENGESDEGENSVEDSQNFNVKDDCPFNVLEVDMK